MSFSTTHISKSKLHDNGLKGSWLGVLWRDQRACLGIRLLLPYCLPIAEPANRMSGCRAKETVCLFVCLYLCLYLQIVFVFISIFCLPQANWPTARIGMSGCRAKEAVWRWKRWKPGRSHHWRLLWGGDWFFNDLLVVTIGQGGKRRLLLANDLVCTLAIQGCVWHQSRPYLT